MISILQVEEWLIENIDKRKVFLTKIRFKLIFLNIFWKKGMLSDRTLYTWIIFQSFVIKYNPMIENRLKRKLWLKHQTFIWTLFWISKCVDKTGIGQHLSLLTKYIISKFQKYNWIIEAAFVSILYMDNLNKFSFLKLFFI